MNSGDDSQTLHDPPFVRISLRTPKGSHIPSFKNQKRAIKDSKTGKLRTLTEPKAKRWMEACIRSFVSQLLSGEATKGNEIPMGVCQQSWTALSMPATDSMNTLKELHIYVTECDQGEEGAEIIIERI